MSAEWAQQQLEKFKFSFDEADKDKSGSLSVEEVYDILNNNGFKGSKDEAKLCFILLGSTYPDLWAIGDPIFPRGRSDHDGPEILDGFYLCFVDTDP